MQTVSQFPPGLNAIRGAERLSPAELADHLRAGARCVRFEWCASLLIATIRRQSPVYLTYDWQDRYLRGLRYSLAAVLLGPWGVPWGLVWTPWAVWVNLTGGADVTDTLLRWLDDHHQEIEA